jgi:arabinofuranosyltransferase
MFPKTRKKRMSFPRKGRPDFDYPRFPPGDGERPRGNMEMRDDQVKTNAIAILVLAACLVLLAFLEIHFYGFTVDDAYISLRYAKNLAAGHGLVFNIGERVEGYTNLLWTLLLGLLIRLGAEPVAASKITGGVFSFLTVLLLWRVSLRLLWNRPWLRNLPILFLAATPSFAIYAVSGLETAMFCFILTLALFLFIREENRSPKFHVTSIVLFLLTLTRPEGVLFFVIFGSVKYLHGRNLKRVIWWAWPYLLLLAIYLVWKLAYFGNILPNTFYAKTGRGLVQYAAGLLYTYAFFKNYGGILLFVLVLLPLMSWLKRDYAFRQTLGVLLISTALWIIYNVYKGHDPLPSFRFFVLIMPFIYLLVSFGLGILYDGLCRMGRSEGMAGKIGGVTILAIVCLMLFNDAMVAYLSTNDHPKLRGYQLQINEMNANFEFAPMGRLLESIAPPDARIAVIDAGAIPYYSELYTIDRWGLIDPHIARVREKGPLGEKFDADYIMKRKPEFIQTKMYRRGYERLINKEKIAPSDFTWPGDYYLFKHPEFRSDYEMCEDPILNSIFVRKDVQLRPPEGGGEPRSSRSES